MEVCGSTYLVCGFNKYPADASSPTHTDSIWCESVTGCQLQLQKGERCGKWFLALRVFFHNKILQHRYTDAC